MKKYSILLILLCFCVGGSKSQVILNEEFNSPFNPNLNGWSIVNNSSPTNTLSWMQGNGPGGNLNFPAYSGLTNDFYGADTRCVTQGSGGISAWLITPTLTIYDGAVLQFATRTATGSPVRPDRMQVLMSQNALISIPAGSASIGSFTGLLLDINPNLTTNTSSVVTNGVVNGYPQTWTVYTIQISGVTGTVTGRFAFRYFVDNSGSGGINGNMIGIDNVKYTLPCSPVVNSYTMCPGNSATLVASGGLPSTTYQWSNGGTGSVVVVSPSVTTVYTLSPGNGTTGCGTQMTSTVTLSSQLSVSITASSQTVCAGKAVTLTAQSAATSFTWSNTGNLPVKIFVANSTQNYSVSASNGSCTGFGTINIVVNPKPTLSYVIPYTRCPSATMNVQGFGASTYVWTWGNNASTNNPVSVTNPSNTSGGTYSMALEGISAQGCSQFGQVNVPYSANPIISATVSGDIQCVNTTATISATGANTYTWTGDTTSNASSFTLYNGTTPTIKTLSVAGTSASTGCSGQTALSYTVSICTGLESVNANFQEIAIIPNPFTDALKNQGMDGFFEIYNALGQIILNKYVLSNEVIDTSTLPIGSYMVKIRYGNSYPKTLKLLKITD